MSLLCATVTSICGVLDPPQRLSGRARVSFIQMARLHFRRGRATTRWGMAVCQCFPPSYGARARAVWWFARGNPSHNIASQLSSVSRESSNTSRRSRGKRSSQWCQRVYALALYERHPALSRDSCETVFLLTQVPAEAFAVTGMENSGNFGLAVPSVVSGSLLASFVIPRSGAVDSSEAPLSPFYDYYTFPLTY